MFNVRFHCVIGFFCSSFEQKEEEKKCSVYLIRLIYWCFWIRGKKMKERKKIISIRSVDFLVDIVFKPILMKSISFQRKENVSEEWIKRFQKWNFYFCFGFFFFSLIYNVRLDVITIANITLNDRWIFIFSQLLIHCLLLFTLSSFMVITYNCENLMQMQKKKLEKNEKKN